MSRWRVPAAFVFVLGAGLFLVGVPSVALFAPASDNSALAANCTPSLPHASGHTYESMVSGGYPRNYHLQVPPSYDGTTQLPLVFLFHGRNWTTFEISSIALFTRFDTKANAAGFILVYPEGLPGPGGGNWFNPFHFPGYADDLLFIDDLINHLESQLCIDPARIFSTGISNGAIMSVGLACNMSDRIAAIAPVDAVYYPPWSTTLLPTETCPDTRPVPVMAFHGTNDLYIPYTGGTGANGITGLRNIETAVMPDWATHNGCSTTPVNTAAASGVTLHTYPVCAGGADTMLYEIYDADGPGPSTEGMGHQWPDSIIDPVAVPPNTSLGLNTHQINATNLIWDFFAAHTMPAAATPTPIPTPTPQPTPTPIPPPGPPVVGGIMGLVDEEAPAPVQNQPAAGPPSVLIVIGASVLVLGIGAIYGGRRWLR